MRGYWFVVGLAVGAATGCSEWPRAGNLGDEPDYVPGGEDVTAPITNLLVVDEASTEGGEFPDDPVASAENGTNSFGIAQRFLGTLDKGGWNDESQESPGCGPVAPGYYDGDTDGLLIVPVETETYFCARGRLDSTEDIGWDLSLIELQTVENGTTCLGPVVDPESADSEAIGSGLTTPEAVWGVNVPPGVYALLIGAYSSPNADDLNVDYTVHLSIWAPFSGSAQQCPLLDAEVAE